MPADEPWPDSFGTPLPFLGQIRVADLPPGLDGHELLPTAGVLAFFYDVEEQPWGSADDRFGSKLLLFDAERDVAARAQPEGVPVFPAHVITYRPVLTLPGWETTEVERMLGASVHSFFVKGGTRPTVLDQLNDLHRMLEASSPTVQAGRWDSCHRLLGWADQIQGDLHRSDDEWNGHSHEPLEPCSHDWRLLLQVDTDDRLGWMWGDVGRLYLSIDANAPFDERFTSPPVILQCS